MFGSIIILFLLPWLDTSRVRSARFRPVYKVFFWLFVACCFALGWAGAMPAEGLPLLVGQFATVWYFAHFLIIVPIVSSIERPDPLVAPLTKGQPLGKLIVTSTGGAKVAEVPLVVLEDVPEAGIVGRLWDSLRLWIK